MNKRTFLGLSLTLGFIVFSGACNQAANHVNTTTNHNGMNHNGMNHNSMTNHNGAANANHNMAQMHSETMKSDPNAASAPFDLQFIDTMTHHHEGAVRMAEMVLQKSNDEELKKFAQKIIDDQRQENAQMKGWRENWYAGKPMARNMEMPGMMDSMKMMSGNQMKMMETMTGKDFDLHFLDMMIPHHEGAVKMAKDASQKAEHAEIKTLAGEIIKEQEAEIKKMRDWKAKWSK
jgi:uncharacterized protein (DUF305 family)